MSWDERWRAFSGTLAGVVVTTLLEAFVVLSLGWVVALALWEIVT